MPNNKRAVIYFMMAIVTAIPFSCKDCLEVDVPFTEEEAYEELEEYKYKLQYQVGESTWKRVTGETLFDNKPRLESTSSVTNTDEKGGEFTVVKQFRSTLGDLIRLEDSEYIPAGGTTRFDFSYELDHYVQVRSEGYEIVPPIVTGTRPVQKYRKVIKYRKCNTCVEDCESYYKE